MKGSDWEMGKKLSPWESQLQIIKKVSDFMCLEPAVYEVVNRPKARAPEAVALARTRFLPSRAQTFIAFS